MADKSNNTEDNIVIKKYANRRLYNTATSSYVTLDTLCTMVKDGQNFVVQDAKSGADITRSVLTQIIFEEESKGQNLLPISFLRQLIGFYGDSLQTMVPDYLESTMSAFAHNQDKIRQHLTESMGGVNPFHQMEEIGRQNMAMFQGMFTPFASNTVAAEQPAAPEPTAERDHVDDNSGGDGGGGEELDLLRRQLAQMQQQLDNLSNKG